MEDGFVSSNRVIFNGSNAIVLWINSNYSIENGFLSVITPRSSGGKVDSFIEFVKNNFADDYASIRSAINYSVITVEDRGSYGIY
ncbi:hypothetical protein, partial [Bartonella sp. TT110JLCBS]|uniref:hypothetical protein n=1 Tax=Bartonella sp. TT110JLCBS TaxID=3243578 RepID=UPI0035CFD28C